MSNWTPGPWGIYHGRDVTGEGFTEVRTQGGNGHAVVTWFDDMDDEPDATLELIALAPEMAEAILKFCDAYETDQWFQDVAAKLRAIGEDNE